jgi:anti-sigma factor RsiW
MMPCGQDRDMLAVYLDGELQVEQGNALEQHLRTCTECAAEVAGMMCARRAMRAAKTRFTPSAQFRQKMQSQIAPKRRGFGSFGFLPLALAALAIFVVALVWSHQNTLQADAFREVADLHTGDLASANPYDVVSSDRHTVKPWFQGHIPFAFNLPEFTGTEFTLLGGRLVYLHQQPAAQVVVGMRQHKISVLILQDSSALATAFPLSTGADVRNSFNTETWSNHGLRFFVIGDAEKA